MTIADLIYESVKPLPASAAQEVLDFARFLLERQQRQEERDLLLAQQASLADWENDEDEVWNDAPTI